ncbi:MAG: hypothetical protein JRI25_16975 [Deltaproteobacteria bacterium]|nr:hypothetical protein [Deltaproteobacteria bacterium]MBW2256271.1 hypothetical protein [Deltaproteobacteria bacterium]
MRFRWIAATAAALLLAASLTSPALAAGPGLDARIDAVKDDIKADKKRVKDNKKDLKHIQKLRKKWEKARDSGKQKKEAKVDADIAEWLQEQLAEDRMEVGEARAELVAGGGDPAPPTREKPRVVGRDVQPAHPPRREAPAVADDRGDLAAERADLRKTREIARELRDMQQKFNRDTAGPKAYKRKSRLLAELERSAVRDLQRAERERAEDEAQLDKLKAKR